VSAIHMVHLSVVICHVLFKHQSRGQDEMLVLGQVAQCRAGLQDGLIRNVA
jgi:hypothetical protein